MMGENALGWLVIAGTAALAALLAAAAVLSAVLAAKRKRASFLALGGAFLIAAAVALLANPIANLVIFHKVADRNTRRLIEDMKRKGPVGLDAGDFVAQFGRPSRTRTIGGREIWTYDANPWWMRGWTEIEIGVVGNRIEGHWLED